MRDSMSRLTLATARIALFSGVAMLGMAQSAEALPCLEDRFGSKVNCTANDIRISEITDIVVTDDGCQNLDDTVTFNATLTVVTTATARYDIGLFIGEDGAQAETGECTVYALPNSPSPPFVNLDSDTCGDSQSSVILEVPVTGVTVDCADANQDGQLDIATCTSWQQNSGDTCSGPQDVVPGTASKCNCPTTPTDIPIFVPDPVCITNADCEALAEGCLTGVCDVANPNASAFGCVFTPTDSLCDDDLFCNGEETCDDDGQCVDGTAPDCDDDVACTSNTCNEDSDSCVNTPNDSLCDDDLFCNGEETCDATNGCEAGTAPDCDDDVACTSNTCNEDSDSCVNTPNDALCDDDLFCNGEETCDATNGCEAGTAPVCDDDIPCTLDACNEDDDACTSTANDLMCNDQDACTEDLCAPNTGCEHLGICENGICRSPGFWGTHGGFEKDGPNITQDVLDAVGGLEVCGQEVTETSNMDAPYLDGLGLDSALEGLCSKTDGVKQRSLYRHLLAAALNCAISGSADCDETVGQHTDISFDECDALCAGDPVEDGPTYRACTRQLDCYNNGGEIIEGDCAFGNCSITGELCGGDYGECPLVDDVPQECEDFPGNCHDAEFCSDAIDVCPASTGPASSSRACREARGNDCTIDDCD